MHNLVPDKMADLESHFWKQKQKEHVCISDSLEIKKGNPRCIYEQIDLLYVANIRKDARYTEQ